LNALFPLVNSLEKFLNDGSVMTKTSKVGFDVSTLREISVMEVRNDSGVKKALRCNERFYVPSELSWMLKTLGFRKIEIFGCTVGKFSRNVKPSSNEFELLVIAEK
jgi:hypothetical protein